MLNYHVFQRGIKNKHVGGIVCTMAFAIGVVSLLAWRSLELMNKKNGFTRKIDLKEVKILKVLKKDESVVEISGVTNSNIYYKTINPSILFNTDRNLENINYLNINIPQNNKIATAFATNVDSPNVSIIANNVPGIINTSFNFSVPVVSHFFNSIFTRSAKIGPNSYIIRGFDSSLTKGGRQIFIKYDIGTGIIDSKNYMDERENDFMGIISDGYLSYDSSTSLLMYVFFYENTVICIDTNLNFKYKGKTIDTTYINTANAISNKQMTYKGPTMSVNIRGTCSAGKLYNISNLKSDNETGETFRKNSLVDVYDIKSGKYDGSFYIPNYNGQRVNNFRVVGNEIIAVYKNYIVSYSGE